jgi:hypothetical protein
MEKPNPIKALFVESFFENLPHPSVTLLLQEGFSFQASTGLANKVTDMATNVTNNTNKEFLIRVFV